ncbi:MAG: DUF559 domain-containing protein [bacterium]|nr:DUF559 domain-containing protein [bacterium]
MAEHNHEALGVCAASQHGVFSRTDAQSFGISDGVLRYRVGIGMYRQLAPGVYAVIGSVESVRQRISAAVKSMPSLAAVSHQTAAELWGLTDRGIRSIEVVTTRWDRVKRIGVTVHESLDLMLEDIVHHDGLAVTSPARTVVDLGASNKWIVEAAFERGIRHGLFTLAEVEQLLMRVARRGRRGVGVIRPVIEKRRRWDTSTESALEDDFRNLLDDEGIRPPQPQYVVKEADGRFVCRADFAYPLERLLIELDSEAHHLDRMTFRRDRSKQNRAVVLGWTVLRYTWWDVHERPSQVCTEVAAALEQA